MWIFGWRKRVLIKQGNFSPMPTCALKMFVVRFENLWIPGLTVLTVTTTWMFNELWLGATFSTFSYVFKAWLMWAEDVYRRVIITLWIYSSWLVSLDFSVPYGNRGIIRLDEYFLIIHCFKSPNMYYLYVPALWLTYSFDTFNLNKLVPHW